MGPGLWLGSTLQFWAWQEEQKRSRQLQEQAEHRTFELPKAGTPWQDYRVDLPSACGGSILLRVRVSAWEDRPLKAAEALREAVEGEEGARVGLADSPPASNLKWGAEKMLAGPPGTPRQPLTKHPHAPRKLVLRVW